MTDELFAGSEAHVVERLEERSLTSLVDLVERGDCLGDTDTHSGVCAVGDTRLDVGSVEVEFLVEHGVITALEGLPVFHCLVPSLALRSELATLDIFECCLVGSDKSSTRTHLD